MMPMMMMIMMTMCQTRWLFVDRRGSNSFFLTTTSEHCQSMIVEVLGDDHDIPSRPVHARCERQASAYTTLRWKQGRSSPELTNASIATFHDTCHHRLRGSTSTVLTATGQVNGRWRILTPHRIETHEPTATTFRTIDYVRGRTP